MKHKYAAKVYLQDGEILTNTGDDVDELIIWMQDHTESSYDLIKGEIIETATQQIVKHFQYTHLNDAGDSYVECQRIKH